MSKHTPGPWRWSDDYQARDLTDTWSLLGADGFGILSCDGKCNSPQEVNQANASLIAAAPDLLEALRKTKTAALPTEVRDVVNAAIAKATGVQS